MSHGKSAGRLSRRAFVRSVGLAVGGCIGGSLLSDTAPAGAAATHGARASPVSLAIGVVLPQSRIAPQFGASMLNGLRLAVDGADGVRLLPIWYGAHPNDGTKRVEELLATARIDLLVGALSRHEAAALGPLLAEHDTPLLVSDVGANMVRAKQLHPYIFRNSLNHWQSAWALGQWAATNMGRRALIASAFYDSGYDTIYAFWSGFEHAGGQRPELIISHRPDGGSMDDVLAAVQHARPDCVFAAYCGRRAVEFVRAYAAAGVHERVPLLGGGFLVDDAVLPEQGGAATGVRSAHSYAPGLAMREHRAFADRYRAFAGADADAFAALGYDSGRLALAALHGAGADRRAGALRDALMAAAIDGPRGRVQFDKTTLEAHAPVYLREVQPHASGARHVIIDDLSTLAAHDLAAPMGPRSGWRNAYLVA
jgi:branched-chain amino acid transport system substrate-binding protein